MFITLKYIFFSNLLALKIKKRYHTMLAGRQGEAEETMQVYQVSHFSYDFYPRHFYFITLVVFSYIDLY